MHTTRLICNCSCINFLIFVSLFLVILPEFDFGMRSRGLEGESDKADGVHTEPVGDEER